MPHAVKIDRITPFNLLRSLALDELEKIRKKEEFCKRIGQDVLEGLDVIKAVDESLVHRYVYSDDSGQFTVTVQRGDHSTPMKKAAPVGDFF